MNTEALRHRCWFSLSPQTAAAGNMSLNDLKQFIAHMYLPSEAQLKQLARHFNCCGGG
jgi:hypothetical protein